MSYGTPENMDRIEAYYTHIRRGRPPSPEMLRELVARYEAIVGGVFPLRANTDRQVRALQRLLDERHPGRRYVCYQGLKHATPFIEDGIDAMAGDSITEGVGIVLAPHYSVMSVGGYIRRAREQAEKRGIRMRFVESYHLHPLLIEAFSARLRDALARAGDGGGRGVWVIFTAHSLPEKIVELNDPYPAQLLETARAVGEAAGAAEWQFAWQSAGRTDEKWLGPDILDVLQRLAGESPGDAVVIAPIGFVSDHLEILYDIDIEAKRLAGELGIRLERTASLNDDPLFIRALAECVENAAGGL